MSTNDFSIGKLQVVNSNPADIDFIFYLFDGAIEY
jgi:hypothetical protein